MPYDCDETERAIKLHFKWCERNGYIPDQPASYSGREGDEIVLQNHNGVLARYRIYPSGRLRRIED